MVAENGSRLYVGRSAIEGRGCFLAAAVKARHKVAELQGERISHAEGRRRMRGQRRIRISDVDDRTAIDMNRRGDATAFINHSCAPNLFLRVQHGHPIVYALRDIRAGEELLLDYGDSHHDGKLRCRCGAPNCRGWI